MSKKVVVYLAGPYSHPRPAIVEARWEAHLAAYTRLVEKGFVVISPIVQGHLGWLGSRILKKWARRKWLELDFGYLNKADMMVILKIPGWKESKGVQEEIKYCHEHSKPIIFMSPRQIMRKLSKEVKDNLHDRSAVRAKK